MSKRSTGIIDSNGEELFEGDVVKYLWGHTCTGSVSFNVIRYHKMEKKSSGRWGISGVVNTINDGDVTKEDLPEGCELHFSYEAKTKIPSSEYLWKHGGEIYKRMVTTFNERVIKAMRESINVQI